MISLSSTVQEFQLIPTKFLQYSTCCTVSTGNTNANSMITVQTSLLIEHCMSGPKYLRFKSFVLDWLAGVFLCSFSRINYTFNFSRLFETHHVDEQVVIQCGARTQFGSMAVTVDKSVIFQCLQTRIIRCTTRRSQPLTRAMRKSAQSANFCGNCALSGPEPEE